MVLRISVLDHSIFRLRYATDGFFTDDFSYALDKDYTWPCPAVSLVDHSTFYELRSDTLSCRIHKTDCCVGFFTLDNKTICVDEKGFHWENNEVYGGDIVQLSKKAHDGERYYGLGDKPMAMNMRGKRLVNWGTDEYGFNKDQDPIYKNIPFYIGIYRENAYGIFFDNTFKTHFDFSSERRGTTSFWADGGEMNYYFIYVPDPIHVVERYTHLTGKPELTPLWALGYHQCKWSYYPESKVKEIAQGFREKEIPCDALYLDIDYMDGFRCFTWDKEKFPDPTRMIGELMEDGFKTVVMIDPGIKVDKDYWVFKEGFENNYFCKRADGPLMVGKVWPGDCAFPDYTSKKVRKWWSGLYKEMIAEQGVRGVWNDMNEPAVFEVESKTFPLDVRHSYDGHHCSHRKAHNVYGMQMVRATYHGVKQFVFPYRPFVITRSLYAGTQRYCSAWTGDNIASWEHIFIANMQCLRMAISGFSFIGTDIGGFIEQPTSELYIRYMQLGVFHPFFRTHSSGDHGDQEPWSFGKMALDIVRDVIELRYKLLPYIYSTFYQYITNGTPILRPIAFAFHDDPETHHRQDEFLMGDHLLACPVMEPGVKGRYMYLPKGRWYNIWTEEVLEGGEESWHDIPIQRMALYVREGAIIPIYPVMQYVGEKVVDELMLHVFYKEGTEQSFLYEDSGDKYDYEHGDHNLKNLTFIGNGNSIKIEQNIEGEYSPTYKHAKIVIHGLSWTANKIKVNGKGIETEIITDDSGLTSFKVRHDFTSVSVLKAGE